MIALITGASSGLGWEAAKSFAKRGFNLVLVARRRQRLFELKEEILAKYPKRKIKIICRDLSKTEECKALYEDVKNANIDILFNNAGFGVFGSFADTSLEDELKMIDVNIKAVHTLTKLFLRRFRLRNHGYILNTASLAGFMAGPYFSSYYASKNYVLQLTKAVHEELRAEHSNVYIGAFCPGPVKTEFNETAGAEFAIRGLNAHTAVEYAIEKMFDGQLIIVPTLIAKATVLAARVTPTRLMLAATGKVQRARKVRTPAKEDDSLSVNHGLTEEEIRMLSE